MATISKATIKAGKHGGKKRYCFILVTIFVILVGLYNFFINEPGGILKDVEQSVTGGNSATTTRPQAGVATTSDNVAHAGANDGNDAAPVDGIDSNDPFYPKDVDSKQLQYIFHHTPSDRAGKEAHVILDMMMGHAYAFHQRKLYGGSCGGGNDVGRDPERALLKAIGLDHVLKFACPGEIKNKLRQKEVPSKTYQKDGARSLTPEYLDLLKSVMRYPERTDNQYTIAVHIRRGKIVPCRKPFLEYDPYLPNKHYQLLIDKYMKPNAKVVIYSQDPSHESLDEFRDKGYELYISEDLAEVWKSVLNADVFIMSRSDFSFVPALLTKAKVVYTPFWEKAQRGWEVVGKEVMEESKAEFERLSAACPKDSKLSKLRRKIGHHNH
ncbi:hypothetical protein IV203_032860 [Nitzschia inconspicua]|uniref:Uncharacterized protein n=1 Tax=Nitzschia inconspicua TaxID=303405 RepID=A0A9K3PHN6_9STRA|nr:hypothetical protein IV203_032860 [Nitzschia inconspicua]